MRGTDIYLCLDEEENYHNELLWKSLKEHRMPYNGNT